MSISPFILDEYVKHFLSYNCFQNFSIEVCFIKAFNEESINMGNKGLIDLTETTICLILEVLVFSVLGSIKGLGPHGN